MSYSPSKESPPLSSPRTEGTFKRLVRTLSRSRSTREKRDEPNVATLSPGRELPPRTSSKSRNGGISPGAALSTSPPPDSYFPKPPRATLLDSEANGRARHQDSIGARASDVGEVTPGQSAPGVSFAPSNDNVRVRTKEELEGWNPAPRRTQSQRAPRGPPVSSENRKVSNGGLNRSRAGSASVKNSDGSEAGALKNDSAAVGEVRRGVQLEDKPLSRKTSVKRAASAMRKAAEKAFTFEPLAKEEGEKRVLILMADGSEEMETVIIYDILVRASLHPTLVSVSPQFSPSQSLPYVTLSRGAKMMADTEFETLKPQHKDDFDALIIPGGAKGAERLSQDPDVQALIRAFFEQGKLIGMICAGSLAAKTSGIALGQRLTSHPSVKGDLEKHYRYSEDRVVVSGNLVTSRGPGTAMEWALTIVGILGGQAKREEVEGPMCL
ncbi:class I glutamine amidotransferase-like protein [Leucosporidium creatinivorum]|uniref:D-lactate dehydratase n=1 Tax=Leucosporidium creatinivorum TaxID=106004 RepID=A0A1Y2FEL1_9BASI|nr:class I glutamine amidotransferase-like protein [Leucosporidium creatinivorum]